MCDEYDEERMVAFWRRLEELDKREHASPEADEVVEPLVRIEPSPVSPVKPKSRTLAH